MKLKKFSFPIFGVMVFALVIYFSQKHKNQVFNQIEANKESGIAKVVFIKEGRDFSSAHYLYYYKGNGYESNIYLEDNGNQNLNKYYRIDFSSENPKLAKIYLNQEVTDTTEIINAGFK